MRNQKRQPQSFSLTPNPRFRAAYPRLIRADLLLTALVFKCELDADINFRTTPSALLALDQRRGRHAPHELAQPV
jgi:hypothetical protein